ncbi:MAG: septum formation protein Maf [Dehalococcoidia bacterium]|nr:septum formation protein Maf [Dehalococcoidia bacterium]
MSESNGISLLSSSPRRRELIKSLMNPVSISGSRGEEPRPAAGEIAEKYVIRSAIAKLGERSWSGGDGWLVSADTVVVLDGDILGKPNSDEEARAMLTRLRDRRHQVVTGIAVADAGSWQMRCEVETSDIYTRNYSDEDIEAYIARREPFDKAGAYAVQDDEFDPVIRVDGCYLNVVGLPMCLLVAALDTLGARPKLRPLDQIPYYDRCSDCRLQAVSESEP